MCLWYGRWKSDSLEKWLSVPKKKELVRTQACQQESSEKKGEFYENQTARPQGWWKVFLKSMWTIVFAAAQKLQRTLKPRKETTIHLKDRMGRRKSWSKVLFISVFPVLFIFDLVTWSFVHLRNLPVLVSWVFFFVLLFRCFVLFCFFLKSNYFHL